MTSLTPTSKEFEQKVEELKRFCRGLAEEHKLTPYRQIQTPWNEPYREERDGKIHVLALEEYPQETGIQFRNRNNELVAILEVIPFVDKSREEMTRITHISRLDLTILDKTDTYEEFANQFVQLDGLDDSHKIQISKQTEEPL